MSKEIILCGGHICTVDDEDYDWAIQYTWTPDLDKTTGRYYATRKFYENGWKSPRHKVRMHRELLNCPKGKQVDHINQNSLDNRKCNIRICTNSDNRANIVRKNKGTSKYKGVYWSTQYKKFICQIRKDRVGYRLGFFDTEIEAAMCYNENAPKFFGEFARLNTL